MDQTLVDKAQQVGKLLAHSPLSDDVKQVLLDNIEHMKVLDLDLLLDALQKEQREQELFGEKLVRFFEEREVAWQKLEADQKNRMSDLVNEFFRSIEKDLTDNVRKTMN